MVKKAKMAVMASALALLLSGGVLSAQTPTQDAATFKYLSGKIDQGGPYYSIIQTPYVYESIRRSYAGLQTQMALMPFSPPQKAQAAMVMTAIKDVVHALGVDSIRGIAGSSVVMEEGKNGLLPLFHNRSFLYHGDQAGQGLLWDLLGNKNRPLQSDLEKLPANTVAASCWRMSPVLIWQKVQEVVGASNQPMAAAMLKGFEDQFQKENKVPFKQLLEDISGDWLLIVIDGKDADGKVFMQGMLSVPAHNGTTFQLLKNSFAGNPSVVAGQNEISFKLPQEIPPWVNPVFRVVGDRLVVASHPDILAASAKAAAEKNGWIKTDDYRRLSQRLPGEGSGFSFLSRRYLAAYSAMMGGFMPTMKFNLPVTEAKDIFSVFSREKDGVAITMNSNMDLNEIAMAKLNLVAIPIVAGMVASYCRYQMRMPSQTVGPQAIQMSDNSDIQQIQCTSNLRRIGMGLMSFARQHQGVLPAADNAAGLDALVKDGYNVRIFVCPSDDDVEVSKNKTLTDANCSYIYIGGLSTKGDFNPMCPLVFDVPGAHGDVINVLYMDGHVMPLKAPGITTCAALIKQLDQTNHYPPKLLEKLQAAAKRIDAQMGLGEE
ncbi:MAG: hypothetical protein PHQ27_04420 [Victivallales bacterium]|nr:hypothetical protein [Victivallales bacterium]